MQFINTDIWGFEHAIRGMRNALESWDKIDSEYINNDKNEKFQIGCNDLKLMQNLILAGNEHAKFMRMIHVSVDTNMPRYWWSEEDTYSFGVKNSCSTMHRLLNNNTPITIDQFLICEEDLDWWIDTISKLETLRQAYKNIQKTTKDEKEMNRLLIRAKRILPEGYEQMRTWDTNYAELRNIYFQRRYHRLKEEWVDKFCGWLRTLPYAEDLIMLDNKESINK